VDLTANPPGFYGDEAAYGVNADAVLHHARDEYGSFLPAIFRSFGDFKLPFFVYTLVPFVAVIGKTVFAVRFADAVLGSLTVLALYFLALELFRDKRQALLATGFLAIAPWQIHFSRTGFGEVVSCPLLLIVSTLVFLKATQRPALLPPAFFLFGLTMYTYRAAWPAVPILLVVLFWLFRSEVARAPKQTALGLVVFGVMLLPLAHHLLYGPGDRAEQTSILNSASGLGLPRLFVEHYLSYFSPSFLFEKADANVVIRHYLPGHGVLYWAEAPLLGLGLALLLLRRRRADLVALALVAVFPLGGALSDASPISSRSLLGAAALGLVAGRGGAALIDLGSSRVPARRIAAVAALVAIAAGTIAGFATYTAAYYRDYPVEASGFRGWQYGGKEIVDYYVSVQGGYDDLLIGDGFDSAQELMRFFAFDSCPRCRTGDIEQIDPGRKQLIALGPDSLKRLPGPYTVRHFVRRPDGPLAFVIVEPETRQRDSAGR